MTYVVLIVPDSPFLLDPLASFPPLGVMYLAVYLRKHGHKCEIVDLTGRERTRKDDLYMETADVVGITSTTPQFPVAVEILKKVKEAVLNAPNVFIIRRRTEPGSRVAEFVDMVALLHIIDNTLKKEKEGEEEHD